MDDKSVRRGCQTHRPAAAHAPCPLAPSVLQQLADIVTSGCALPLSEQGFYVVCTAIVRTFARLCELGGLKVELIRAALQPKADHQNVQKQCAASCNQGVLIVPLNNFLGMGAAQARLGLMDKASDF